MLHSTLATACRATPACLPCVLFSLWPGTLTTPRRLLVLTILSLVMLLLSMPAFGLLTVRTLEMQNPPLAQLPEDTEALVVLGTYVLDVDTVRPRPELDPDCRKCGRGYAAELYHQKQKQGRRAGW